MVNFASGQQCQTELRLYLWVGVLKKFQQSSHRDGWFACGGYSLRAGTFLFSIEPFLELLSQFHAGELLDMGIKINILWGQTYDLALSQRAQQCEVDCQMQDGVLHLPI